MIIIKSKEDCCGCGACVQGCPLKCISLFEDNEGFLYPNVNLDVCNDCGYCESICPVINPNLEIIPIKILAAKNNNTNIRLQSSSGGIFSLLAKRIIQQDGVVFGAKFNDSFEVIHDYIDSIDNIHLLRGSKYVQSVIGNSYINAEFFLKSGKKVLFSGTSCQIAGLHNFLRKSYENLYTIDVVCHGVPSPKVWRLYLNELIRNKINIKFDDCKLSRISFRNKNIGWKKYKIVIKGVINKTNKEINLCSEFAGKNIFMKGFLKDLYLRPSCYKCPSKSFSSKSDIMLADYWGIDCIYPEFDDDKGTSLIFINTSKGDTLLKGLDFESIETSLKDGLLRNPSITSSVDKNKNREIFFSKIDLEDISYLIYKYTKDSLSIKIKKVVIYFLIKTSLIKLLKRNGRK